MQLISMWGEIFQAFVVAAIGGTILIIPEVGAQPTVDDSASCESSTLDEAVNLIKEDLEDAKLIRKDLKDVKDLLQTTQQQNNASRISMKDMEDLTAACTTDTSSSISEAVSLIREDFEEAKLIREYLKDLKNLLGSNQQQNNATCISTKDLENLKAACTGCTSNQQQCPQTQPAQPAVPTSLLCEYRTHETRLLQGVVCTTY